MSLYVKVGHTLFSFYKENTTPALNSERTGYLPRKSMNTHHRARDVMDTHCSIADGFRSSQSTAQLFHNDLLQVEHKVDRIQKDVGIVKSVVQETNTKVGTLVREVGSLCVAAEDISVRLDRMSDTIKDIKQCGDLNYRQHQVLMDKLDVLHQLIRKRQGHQ